MRIALFEPDIPQNTGNIFRLSACLDIKVELIGPMGFVLDDKRLKRSAMDYYKFINFNEHIDWKNFYSWSVKNEYRIILITTKGNKKYISYEFRDNDIILFGSETSGVPKFVHELANERLYIPMKKGLRSLNLSSSVAIVIGEAKRQLNFF